MNHLLKKYASLFLFALLFCVQVQAQSKFYSVFGQKYPNSAAEGSNPVSSRAMAPVDPYQLGGFNELIPYVTASPDQEEAGTCLFMSLTGAVEWWLHRIYNQTFVPEGNLDLSERWWVNLSTYDKHTENINNWNTDGIYLFNSTAAVLNRDYRFTKGWYVEGKDEFEPAAPNTPGAIYDAGYNWIDDSAKVRGHFVRLPTFSRRVIYADPDENPWEIGKAPSTIVERVKQALVEEKSPVQVIYNHQGYWHSVIVLGFDDEAPTYNCPFIHESFDVFQKEEKDARDKAEKTKSPRERDHLLSRANKMRLYNNKLKRAFEKTGCASTGVFYVRDSQYSDPTEPIYHYDFSNPQADRPYSKRIILREYEWLKTLSNHAMVIKAEMKAKVKLK
ncbi:MAG: hypothetical protein BroJett040_11060 [Oligoflexia bacterium]|nr:MAG: hypothetical protein BroJett040_11060 [Oligoflexia bacterium]